MKWITGALEIFLGIPLIGAAVIVGLVWTPLAVMLVLHIVTLVLSVQNNETKYGSIMGIVTSCISWIPFVGMIMHILTGIFLMVSAAKPSPAAASASHNAPPPPPNF